MFFKSTNSHAIIRTGLGGTYVLPHTYVFVIPIFQFMETVDMQPKILSIDLGSIPLGPEDTFASLSSSIA